MKKFKIHIIWYFDTFAHLDDIMSLERMFQTIWWDEVDHCENDVFLKIFERHGSKVRKLQIVLKRKVSNEFLRCMTKIQSTLPLLEELVFYNKVIKSAQEISAAPCSVDLRHLKKLELFVHDYSIFSYLSCPRIVELNIFSSTAIGFDAFINFLKNARLLENLQLSREPSENLLRSEHVTEMPFKLKKIDVLVFSSLDESLNQILANFLKSQASSIEELVINRILCFSSKYNRKIIETIFKQLEKLKVLRIELDKLPNEEEFYNCLVPLKSLKEIDSKRNSFKAEFQAKSILKNCPNLEVLRTEINTYSSDILSFIALNNPKLKHLEITSLRAQTESQLKFQFLNYLLVKKLENAEYMISFLKNQPYLETLRVDWVNRDVLTDELLDVLLNQTKHLYIGGNIKTAAAIFNKIKIDHRKLKSLTMEVRSTPTGNCYGIVEFKFPDHSNDWNLELEKIKWFKRLISSSEV